MTAKKKKPIKKTLTNKEYEFITDYLKDKNGSRAYRRVYKPKDPQQARYRAHEILSKQHIKDFIKQHNDDLGKRCNITRENLLAPLIEIANADILNFTNPDTEDGLILLEDVPNSKAIKDLDIITKTDENGNTIRWAKVKLHCPIKANESIRKMLGLDDEQETNDKIEITINHVADKSVAKPEITIKKK